MALSNSVLGLQFLILYIYTFIAYLPPRMSDRAYSLYFNNDDTMLYKYAKAAIAQNDARYYQAQVYLAEYMDTREGGQALFRPDTHGLVISGGNAAGGGGGGGGKGITHVDLAVGIVSRSREQPGQSPKLNVGYLTQTLASVLRAFQQDTLFHIKYVFVCNVDPNPQEYREALYLTDFADVFVKHADDKNMDKFLDSITDLYETQKEDYVYCLEQSRKKYSSDYLIMLEDDVPLKPHFLKHLHHQINTKLQHNLERHNSRYEDVAFIKLMYPDRWRGYSNTFSSCGELVSLATFGGLFFIVCFRILDLLFAMLPHRVQRSLKILNVNENKRRPKTNIYFVFIWGAVYTLILCYLIGRPYYLQLRSWSPHLHSLHSPAPGCCTLAMLYPQHTVPSLIQYLDGLHCDIDFALDSAVDAFASEKGLKTFVVEPNLADHIGMVSNLRSYAKVAAEYLYIS